MKRCGNDLLTPLPAIALSALLMAPLIFTAATQTAMAGQTDFCKLTAKIVLSSCQDGANSDYRLAVAKCDNISNPSNRQTCLNQAANDLKEAQQICVDEYRVRNAACQRFGPARYDPVINPANFVAVIDNPYFPLTPGTTFVYEGQTPDGLEHDEFAVTHNTRQILGVRCLEVHDTVRVNGELTEDTLDWFAQDIDGNVWYFGENTHELIDGLITTIDGTFMAGEDGAKPGIIMKAHPMIGDFYRQEFSLDNAEDYAETVSLSETVTVGNPPHNYGNCLKSKETTPLEPDLLEYKFYAPGVGNVLTVDSVTGAGSELVEIITKH